MFKVILIKLEWCLILWMVFALSCNRIHRNTNVGQELDLVDTINLDSINSDLSLNYIMSQNSEVKILNQVVIIPLEKLYSANTISLIKSKEYYESAPDLIMGFCIDESDNIILANNDKRIFQFYDLSNSKLSDSIKYPKSSKKDYVDPVSSIFIKENNLYCATYYNSFQFDLKSEIVINEERAPFGKNNNKKLRLMSLEKIELTNESFDLSHIETPDSGLDMVMDKLTSLKYLLFIENKKLKFYSGYQKQVLNIDFKSINFVDVDFLYSNGSEIGFVLKSDLTETENDQFILYDLSSDSIKYSQELPSYHVNLESQLGDPTCLPTGASYLMHNNVIWRIRTTIEGFYIENWECKAFGG